MTPDLKPARRIVDPALMRELSDAGQRIRCLVCERLPTEPHHVRLKSQGGDDVEANIVFLCHKCHGAYHGTPYQSERWPGAKIDAQAVRFKMGRHFKSPAGKRTRSYLVGKLGRGGAESYLKREFGVRL